MMHVFFANEILRILYYLPSTMHYPTISDFLDFDAQLTSVLRPSFLLFFSVCLYKQNKINSTKNCLEEKKKLIEKGGVFEFDSGSDHWNWSFGIIVLISPSNLMIRYFVK